MKDDDSLISVFVSTDGLYFGVGDPDAESPLFAEFCLLCGVTERPVTLSVWRDTLFKMDREGGRLEEACEKIIEEYGGEVILRPSRMHLGDNVFLVEPPEGTYEA